MFDEPEDIFAKTSPPSNLPVGGGVPKSTIPATRPAPATAPAAPQSNAHPQPTAVSTPAMPQPGPQTRLSTMAPQASERAPSKGGIVKTLVVIAVVVGIIAAAGFLSYWLLSRQTTEPVVVPESNTETKTNSSLNQGGNSPNANTQTTNPPANAGSNTSPVPTPETTTKIVDVDGDGLSDAQEMEIGTSVSMVDTDSDGLSDREEVQVYKTDPLLSDTDADGYSDGEEVSHGYNPKGAGKLFEVPTP